MQAGLAHLHRATVLDPAQDGQLSLIQRVGETHRRQSTAMEIIRQGLLAHTGRSSTSRRPWTAACFHRIGRHLR